MSIANAYAAKKGTMFRPKQKEAQEPEIIEELPIEEITEEPAKVNLHSIITKLRMSRTNENR